MSDIKCRVFLQNKEEIYQLFSIFENRGIIWRNGRSMFEPNIHIKNESIYLFFKFSPEGKIEDVGYIQGKSSGEEFKDKIKHSYEILLECLIMHDSETNRSGGFFKFQTRTTGGERAWI